MSIQAIVDPKDFAANSFVDRKTDCCIIPPNSFALARTVEYFRVPRDVLVICLGKSTYARCGIIVNVTPLEPEWEGHVTLEFSNTTPLPAKIYANEGACQFLFLQGNEPCETSYADRAGKYMGQRGVTLAAALSVIAQASFDVVPDLASQQRHLWSRTRIDSSAECRWDADRFAPKRGHVRTTNDDRTRHPIGAIRPMHLRERRAAAAAARRLCRDWRRAIRGRDQPAADRNSSCDAAVASDRPGLNRSPKAGAQHR